MFVSLHHHPMWLLQLVDLFYRKVTASTHCMHDSHDVVHCLFYPDGSMKGCLRYIRFLLQKCSSLEPHYQIYYLNFQYRLYRSHCQNQILSLYTYGFFRCALTHSHPCHSVVFPYILGYNLYLSNRLLYF